jgi:hypothetical protein
MRRHGIHGYGLLMVLGLAWLVGQQARPLSAQQTGGLPALERRVAALEAKVISLQQNNTDQTAEIVALKRRLGQVESKLAFVSVEGTDMVITGANLHLRNGLGATNGNPGDPFTTDPTMTLVNGTGNLTIGYNEGAGTQSGSHNLVMGNRTNHASYGGIAAGVDNSALAPYASVLGGRSNRAIGTYSTIVGGAFNVTTIDGNTASILGGNANQASAIDATIAGGNANAVTARFTSIGGGSGITQSVEFGWSAGSFGPVIQGRIMSP